jgi:hypothetical protein
MTRLPRGLRGPLAIASLLVLAVVVAIPVLAASPSPAPSGHAAASAGASGEPDHGGPKDKGPRASHAPEVQVTLRGTVTATTNADGSVDYTLVAGGRSLRLEVGPKWYWGHRNPLKASVGKTVTVVGEQSADEVDVQSVDGVAIRQPGKPPWAGGWKVQGSIHPGWSQDKADRLKAKEAAKQQRMQAKAACKAAGTCADDDPDESAQAGSQPAGS